jgi:ribonuclease G
VAEQLRIRSIGGMIVVDFIDMDRPSNRDKVTRAFNDFLKRDRAKAAVTRISELGLVEMTRKRTRESLLHHLTEPCSHCEGKGYTKSRRTIAYEMLRELRRSGNLIEGDTVLVDMHPEIAQVLAGPDRVYLEEMEKRLQKRIVIKGRGSFHLEDFEIRSPSDKQPLEKSTDAAKDDSRESRRKRRRRRLGPPAEVEALLEQEERETVVDPEALAGERAAMSESELQPQPPSEPSESAPAAQPAAAEDDQAAEPAALHAHAKPEG